MRCRLAYLIVVLGLFPIAVLAVEHTNDARPAATVLLPYFEVDPIANFPESPDSNQLVGVPKTVFTVGNANNAPVIARITLWTDMGIPTLSFNLVLTGFDIETIDLKQTFDGILPPRGSCPSVFPDRLPPNDIIGLRNAHTGQASSLFGNSCVSHDHGDGKLRGFVTVDVVTDCDETLLPNDDEYSAILGGENVLWGEWEVYDPAENSSDSSTLVHVESRRLAAAGDYTFYGRFNFFSGADRREVLANVWSARFINVGTFDAGTSVRVWREPRSVPMPLACPIVSLPASQPGVAKEVLVFDETEEVVSIPAVLEPFPLVAQRVQVNGPDLPVPFGAGWLLLNLNSADGTTTNELKQSFVSSVDHATGQFSVSHDGFAVSHPVTAMVPNPPANNNAPAFPSISVSKSVAGGPPFMTGQNITYTINIGKTGPGQRDCDLTDVLNSNLALVSANASSGMATADLPTNTVTWSGILDDVTPTATVTIVATIVVTGPAGVPNTVNVAFDLNADGVSEGTVSAFRNFSVAAPPP